MQPLVSVIVPIYRAEEWIAETILSIMNQTFPRDRMEVILVDNNCDDQSVSIASGLLEENEFVFQIIHEAKQSVSAARNTGVRSATSEWIQFLDSDDLLSPGKMEKQINYSTRVNDEVCCIYSEWSEIDAHGNFIKLVIPDIHNGKEIDTAISILLDKNFLQIGSHILRKRAILSVNSFSDSYLIQDVELYIKLALRGWRFERVLLGCPALLYRKHFRGLSASDPVGFARALVRNARLLHDWCSERELVDDEIRRVVSRAYFQACRSLAGKDWAAFNELDRERLALGLSALPPGPPALRALTRVLGYRNAEQVAAGYRALKALVARADQ